MEDNLLLNKTLLAARLERLHPEATPRWGSMTAQHMIEHLAEVVSFSNGKIQAELAIPYEKAERAKVRMLAPEWEMPKEFTASFMPAESLPELKFSSLHEAIQALFSEMAEFYSFFARNPDATPLHPYFSNLDQGEWLTAHHKHFKHHFEQFGLLDDTQ